MKRISDVVPAESVVQAYIKPADVEGYDLELVSFDFTEGDFGEYAIMKVRDPDKDTEYLVTSGAKPVMAQLEKLSPTRDLPLQIRYVRQGRTWVMV